MADRTVAQLRHGYHEYDITSICVTYLVFSNFKCVQLQFFIFLFIPSHICHIQRMLFIQFNQSNIRNNFTIRLIRQFSTCINIPTHKEIGYYCVQHCNHSYFWSCMKVNMITFSPLDYIAHIYSLPVTPNLST